MDPRNNHNDTPPADYARDVYRWSREQARAFRERRWGEIDRDNVAEEIESVGRAEFDRLVDTLRMLMLHMLTWDHRPEQRSRSRVLSIKLQRNEIKDLLNDSPSLKERIAQAIERAYRRARIDVALDTGLDEPAFPSACPYLFEDVTSRDFSL
jgi:Domain of unknown function DUF29